MSRDDVLRYELLDGFLIVGCPLMLDNTESVGFGVEPHRLAIVSNRAQNAGECPSISDQMMTPVYCSRRRPPSDCPI